MELKIEDIKIDDNNVQQLIKDMKVMELELLYQSILLYNVKKFQSLLDADVY